MAGFTGRGRVVGEWEDREGKKEGEREREEKEKKKNFFSLLTACRKRRMLIFEWGRQTLNPRSSLVGNSRACQECLSSLSWYDIGKVHFQHCRSSRLCS